jgi:hypothetical protein
MLKFSNATKINEQDKGFFAGRILPFREDSKNKGKGINREDHLYS